MRGKLEEKIQVVHGSSSQVTMIMHFPCVSISFLKDTFRIIALTPSQSRSQISVALQAEVLLAETVLSYLLS
jgi:hypothetical protein